MCTLLCGCHCLQDLSVDRAGNTHIHTPAMLRSTSKNCIFTKIFLIPNQHYRVHSSFFSVLYCTSILSPGRKLDFIILNVCVSLFLLPIYTYLPSVLPSPSSPWMPISHSLGSSVSFWVTPLQPTQVQHLALGCPNMDALLNPLGVHHCILPTPIVNSLLTLLGLWPHTLGCPMLGWHPYLFRLSPHPGHPTRTPVSLCLGSNMHTGSPHVWTFSSTCSGSDTTLGCPPHLVWSCSRTEVFEEELQSESKVITGYLDFFTSGPLEGVTVRKWRHCTGMLWSTRVAGPSQGRKRPSAWPCPLLSFCPFHQKGGNPNDTYGLLPGGIRCLNHSSPQPSE